MGWKLSRYLANHCHILVSSIPPLWITATQFLFLFLHCSDLRVQIDRKMKPDNTGIMVTSFTLPIFRAKPPSKKYIFSFGLGITNPAFTLPLVSSPWFISSNVTNYFLNPTPEYHGAFSNCSAIKKVKIFFR